MLLQPRFFPLLAGSVCLVALSAVAAMFFARLQQISDRPNDPDSVRSEFRRILANELSTQAAETLTSVADRHQRHHHYDEVIETVVADIGARMRELGAPLWETQASVLKRALATGDDRESGPAVLHDEVIGEAAPVLSPRQVQILALVQAESRWAEAMGVEPRPGPKSNRSVR